MMLRSVPFRMLAAVVLGLAGAVVMAATYTVDDDGPADFSSIQSAINFAGNGDEIVVKPGRYRETLSFLGKSITVRSESGPEHTVVFLEGETRIVTLDGDSTLSGFTITGGQQRVGGGILVTGGADPVIEDNIIENNVALYNEFTGFPGLGGGIAIEALSEPVITRNVIRGNQAIGDTSGLYAYGGAIDIGDDASAVITSNLIVDNDAGDTGGAISVAYAGITNAVVITNNTLIGNGAGGATPALSNYGGAISVYDRAEVTIHNNIMADNTAGSGGGIYFFANNDNGIDYEANDFDNNQPDDCAGLTASKCNGGQFFYPPLLQDTTGGNYRLRSDSELIDRGFAGSQGSLDADGRSRTEDGDLDGVSTPDIGAFENQRELTRLRFDSQTALSWDGSRNTSMVFDLYRDPVSTLGPGAIGTCSQPGLTTPTATVTADPPAFDGFFFLVAGRDVATGSLGFDRDGSERIAFNACP